MGQVFGRKNQSKEKSKEKTEPEQVTVTEPEAHRSAEEKKNRPTPKRSQQEAARKRSLVPEDRKAAKRRSKEQQRKYANEARRGMIEGDERYLTARDKGPQRRYVRDFVDARFSIGELLIPVAVLVLLATVFTNRNVQLILTFVVYGLFALVILDGFVMNYQLKGRMADKFGGRDQLQRGLAWYATMRSIQMRPLRTPKPQVKRGEYPS